MSGAVEGVALAERLRAAVTYQYMPMSVRRLLSEAEQALTTPPARSYADGVRDAADLALADSRMYADPEVAGSVYQLSAAIRLLSQGGKA